MVKTNNLNNDNHNGEKSTVRSTVHPLELNKVPLGMRIEVCEWVILEYEPAFRLMECNV